MKIHLHTDNHISAGENLAERVESLVGKALSRFSERLTRIEVHLSDVNAHKSGDGVDKRCVLEARPAGHQPIVVTEDAETVELSITGASQKMKRALDHTFGKLDRRSDRPALEAVAGGGLPLDEAAEAAFEVDALDGDDVRPER